MSIFALSTPLMMGNGGGYRPANFPRLKDRICYNVQVEKTVRKFADQDEAARVDCDFYKNLKPNERLKILVELLNHAPEQRLERVYQVTKLSRR